MKNLISLDLFNCDLEQIPHFIFRLTKMQMIDFEGNNFKTVKNQVFRM